MPTTINRWPMCALSIYVCLRRAYASLPDQAAKAIASAVTAAALGRHSIARATDPSWGQLHVSGHDVFWNYVNDVATAYTPTTPDHTEHDYRRRVVNPLGKITDAGLRGYQDVEDAATLLIEGREHNDQFSEGGLYHHLRESYRVDHRIDLDRILIHAQGIRRSHRRSA